MVSAVAARSTLAQSTRFQLAVVGGSATDVLGTTSRAATISPLVSLTPDPHVALAFGGSATAYDNSAWALNGNASAGVRAPLSKMLAFTLNGAAGATNTSFNASYLTTEAIPALELTAGDATVYAGAHAAYATATLPTPVAPGPFGAAPLGGSTTTSAHSASGALFGANIRIAGDPGQAAILGYREQHDVIAGTQVVDRAASFTALNSNVTFTAVGGMHTDAGAQTPFGSGSLSLGVTPTVALELAAGSYAANRLVGTPGGKFLNAGFAVRFASHDGPESALPAATGVGRPLAGATRLSIRADDATRVDVVGDFTDWKPIAAQRAANGIWYIDLKIPAGQYRYAFRIDGKDWRVPEGAASTDDGFGGKTAWLNVSATPAGPAR